MVLCCTFLFYTKQTRYKHCNGYDFLFLHSSSCISFYKEHAYCLISLALYQVFVSICYFKIIKNSNTQEWNTVLAEPCVTDPHTIILCLQKAGEITTSITIMESMLQGLLLKRNQVSVTMATICASLFLVTTEITRIF